MAGCTKPSTSLFASFTSTTRVLTLDGNRCRIWELAMIVRRGSKLEGREILSSELVELGDLTRDMKDRLM